MDLSKPFTYEDKFKSFLELQNFLENAKNPFFIGRLSGNEPNLCGKVLNKEYIPESLILEMLNTAGIHFKSNDQSYFQFYGNNIEIPVSSFFFICL